MSRVFSRSEFHELVWSKPTVQLAKEFGLSDVALGKICRKHDVPKPPLGWWAKKSAGRTVAITKLPRAKAGVSDAIVIAGGETRAEPDALAAAREDARVLASAVRDTDDYETHPVVARTVDRLRKGKPSDNGLADAVGPGLIKASVAPASIDRFELAMNRLAAALTAVGARLVKGETATVMLCGGETIGFSVSEALRRERHVLTPAELAEDEARRRRVSRLKDPWDEVLDPSFTFLRRPQWDYHPTGQLSLQLDAAYLHGSPRRTFGDAKVQRLETLAADIAVGVAVVAAAKRVDRERREEEARRREEERVRREQALRARHVEERRTTALDAVLVEVADLDRLGRLVARLREELASNADGRILTFLEVAERRLLVGEAALSAEGLARRFSDQRLFGDDDDHGFRLPFSY